MAEETEQTELDYWEWIAKVNEKLTLLRLKVLDHKDISEEDYELLRVLFRPYNNGEYPLWQTRFEQISQIVSQPNLFSQEERQEVLQELNGTILAELTPEPIKTKGNDKKIQVRGLAK
jgi:uncharacterized protein YfkK (UPF0435 family)